MQRKPNARLEAEYNKRGSCCEYCKEKLPFINITRDHLVPKINGGTLNDGWVFSCIVCNMRKSNMNLEQYIQFSIVSVCKVLRKVVARSYMISQEEIDKIRYYHKVMKSCQQLSTFKPTV